MHLLSKVMEGIKKPQSIFDVINENINVVNENVLDMMRKMASMEQAVQALTAMFQAPEQPNAHGEDGVIAVSSEHIKPIENE